MENEAEINNQGIFKGDLKFKVLWRKREHTVRTFDESIFISKEFINYDLIRPYDDSILKKSIKLLKVISIFQETLQGQTESKVLIINYWEKNYETHQRKLKRIKFWISSEKTCGRLKEFLQYKVEEALSKRGHVRPCNLLLFINPHSGSKNATNIFKRRVSPILKMAEVKETMVITEYAGHANDYIMCNDISGYDGIVAVGGDGTFSEIANAVLVKQQKSCGVSLDFSNRAPSKPINFVKPGVRLGMIPAGSRNIISWSSQGTNDVVTSTIQIVSGEVHPIDVCSVYEDHGKFLQFSFSSISFGFLSHVLQSAEKKRMVGSLRHEIASLECLIHNKAYPCEVSYLLSSNDNPVDVKNDATRCKYPCNICLNIPSQDSSSQVLASVKDQPCCSKSSFKMQETSNSSGLNDKNINRSHSDSCSNNSKDFSSEIDKFSYDSYDHESKNESISSSKTPSVSSCETAQLDTLTEGLSLQCEDVFIDKEKWQVIRGHFLTVSSVSHSSTGNRSHEGFSPSAHLADGTADLVIVGPTSRLGFTKFSRCFHHSESPFHLPFVAIHRVKGFCFRLLSENELFGESSQKSFNSLEDTKPQPKNTMPQTSNHVSCIDGLFSSSTNYSVWVHKGLVNMFAMPIENPHYMRPQEEKLLRAKFET